MTPRRRPLFWNSDFFNSEVSPNRCMLDLSRLVLKEVLPNRALAGRQIDDKQIERAMAEIFTAATQPLSRSARVAGAATQSLRVAEWLSGWVAEWLSSWSAWVAASATLAELLCGWVAAAGSLFNEMDKILNISISKQDYIHMILTTAWFTNITLWTSTAIAT